MITLLLFLTQSYSTVFAQAKVPTERELINKEILYYNPGTCSTVAQNTSNSTPGAGQPDGLIYPNLSKEAMNEALKKYIQDKRPESPFLNFTDEIVASSQQANINPFIIPVIAFRESGLGTNHAGLDLPNAPWFNSFGRTADPAKGHPGQKGPGNPRTWWVWNSIKASVDYADPYNKKYKEFGGDMSSYIGIRYRDDLDKNDIDGFIETYAPPGDNTQAGNTTADFKKLMRDGLAEMAKTASASQPAIPTPSVGQTDTPTSGSKVYVLGDSITLGAKSQLESGFKAKNIDASVNASVSRSILRKGITEGNKTSGLEVLDIPAEKAKVGSSNSIVIALGTNADGSGAASVYETNMKRLIEKARGINASANIFTVNIFSPAVSKRASYNQVLDRLSTNLKTTVIDVNSKNIPTADNIHPTPAGSQTFANTIIETVAANPGGGTGTSNSATTDGGNCACSQTNTSSGSTAETGNNIETAFGFFVSEAKFSPELAAAFIGNFRQESGSSMSPSVVNGIGATGIVQWLGGRKTNLLAFAAEKGTPHTDLMTQLQFVMHELNGKESGAYNDIKAVSGSGKEYIAKVTHVIRVAYERPGEAEANDPQRIRYAFEVYDDLKNTAPSTSTGDTSISGGCASRSTGGSGFVSSDGYSFPVEPQRKSQNAGISGLTDFPCPSGYNCHGGRGSGVAFDIGRQPGEDASAGAKVYAFTSGTIQSYGLYKGIDGCYDFQLKGDDGFYYWYGHVGEASVRDGDQVKAGEAITTIGPRKCTGNGSLPHLHIDRGCVINGRPQTGGRESCRDGENMKKLMNRLFEEMPE